MSLEDIDDYAFSIPFSEINSDSLCYRRLLVDADFLAETVRFDPEKILRFHLIYETEDGEGSKAKCSPILGRAFVSHYENNKDYSKICTIINQTISGYYSKHT